MISNQSTEVPTLQHITMVFSSKQFFFRFYTNRIFSQTHKSWIIYIFAASFLYCGEFVKIL